jgi:DNA-binding MarR family transcriptional regulator
MTNNSNQANTTDLTITINKLLATTKPKYRKKLNKEQIETLELIYKFRFITGEQLAKYFNKKSSKHVQKRLKILEDQGLIAKHYDKSYKLKGKPAAYYLSPNGARTLAKLTTVHNKDEPVSVMYRDKTLSEGFIAHCQNILSVYLWLRGIYGDQMGFFTKSNLNYEQYSYYPKPLPDAHIQAGIVHTKNFFLEIFEESTPFFVLVRRVKKYIAYVNSEWKEYTPLTILLTCESSSTHKRLRKRIAKELGGLYNNYVTFSTGTLSDLLGGNKATAKWHQVKLYEGDEI